MSFKKKKKNPKPKQKLTVEWSPKDLQVQAGLVLEAEDWISLEEQRERASRKKSASTTFFQPIVISGPGILQSLSINSKTTLGCFPNSYEMSQ